jgi:beta-glucanase (GH16 family)
MRFKPLCWVAPATAAFAAFFMSTVTGVAGEAATGFYRPIDRTYTLKFSDEFNTATLDLTKWTANWLGCTKCITPPVQKSNELAAYDPAQVTVSNGALNLSLISKPVTVSGKYYPYRSGMVQSHDKKWFKYGYFEARIFLPIDGATSKIANWPAWWTNGEDWPYDGENDIMEGLSGGDPCYHFHSPSGGPGGCKKGYFAGTHIYGALWEPGKVRYYYDGVYVGTITSGITSSPMYLILNYAISSEHGGNHRVPATMEVDYVRVWETK